MTERQALLIGVPRCDDLTFEDIGDVVRSDVHVMRDALTSSDFGITECGTDGVHGEASRNRISRAIKEACADAPAGGVLLIYFSGHGVTISGRDYLVPQQIGFARSRVSLWAADRRDWAGDGTAAGS